MIKIGPHTVVEFHIYKSIDVVGVVWEGAALFTEDVVEFLEFGYEVLWKVW